MIISGRLDSSKRIFYIIWHFLFSVAVFLSVFLTHYSTAFAEQTTSLPIILTPEQKTWLQAHPDIKFAFTSDFEPLLIVAEDGSMSGIMKDILDMLNQRLGTNFGITVADLLSVHQMVKDKKVAGQLATIKGQGPALNALETQAFFTTYITFFKRDTFQEKLEEMEDLTGKKIAAIKDTYHTQQLLFPIQDKLTILNAASGVEALKMLYESKADYMLGFSFHNYQIASNQFAGLVPAWVLTDKPIKGTMSIRDDWPELVSIINKGLQSIPEEELNRVLSKWISPAGEESIIQVVLSPEERKWMAQQHSVNVHVLDTPPFMSMRDGEPQGIMIDYLKIISERTGVTFEYTNAISSWRDAVESLKKHEGVDLLPAMTPTAERKQYFNFSNVYISSPRVIITREDEDFVSSLDNFAHKKIAGYSGDETNNVLKAKYPDIELILFDTLGEPIMAVARGQADALISNLSFAPYFINTHGITNLKVAGHSLLPDDTAAFGIRKDWPELVGIINKGLATITLEEQTAIRNKYIAIRYDQVNTAAIIKWILVAAGMVAGIILIFVFWNRSLKKQVAARTAELKVSEEKYRDIFESLQDGFLRADMEGNILLSNEVAAAMLDYELSELMGKNLVKDIYFYPEQREQLIEILFRDSKFDKYELAVKRKDGSKAVTEVSAHIIYENGQPVATESTIRDITDRKLAEMEKEKLESQLLQAQKMEAIGTLAGGIAHDFNNILSSIFGYAELAKIEKDNEESLTGDLDEITLAATRAKELVQQILTFSRKTEQKMMPLEATLIVKEVIKLLRSSIPKTIKIEQEIGSKPKIMADPTQIHQLVLNVCTNAFHAMEEEGGVMAISLDVAEVTSERILTTGILKPGSYMHLQVKDTGHGIPQAEMDRIFDPYYTTKEQGKGTGLGLAIVQGIVQSHGGKLHIESSAETGTTVAIFLPVCDEEVSTIEISEPQDYKLSGTETVLLVDDEVPILKAAEKNLSKYGYYVRSFTSSNEALDKFQQEPDTFDLVITDMTMPDMTGDKLVEKMLAIRPDLKTILWTGYSEKIDREKALSLGIKEYLEKPVQKNQMLAAVRHVLDG